MKIIANEDVEMVSGGLQFLDDMARQAGRDLASFMNAWDSAWGDVSKAWIVYSSM